MESNVDRDSGYNGERKADTMPYYDFKQFQSDQSYRHMAGNSTVLYKKYYFLHFTVHYIIIIILLYTTVMSGV